MNAMGPTSPFLRGQTKEPYPDVLFHYYAKPMSTSTAQLAQLLHTEASVLRSAASCLHDEIETVGGGFYRSLRPLRTLGAFAETLREFAWFLEDAGHQLDVSGERPEGAGSSEAC